MFPTIRISRSAVIPDSIRVARYEKAPELGPRILFFSGGTALNALSRHLTRYTHNSIHIVTTFDSGGSSAKLREAFDMPSVGDLRSRLMALADQSVKGNPEIVRLFAFRLPTLETPVELKARLEALIAPSDTMMLDVPRPMRDLIRRNLSVFREYMPEDFDLRGASVGNLILAGGYLLHGRDIDPVVFLFSRLVESRGTVVPVCGEVFDLGAELENGEVLHGQHRLTGKACPPIHSPIRRIFLYRNGQAVARTDIRVPETTLHHIAQADLICFAMGSFYSSILVNLYPVEITRAVRANPCPKVYVPNTGCDPEQLGLTLSSCVNNLLSALGDESDAASPNDQLLHLVLLDNRKDGQERLTSCEPIAKGVSIVETELITDRSAPLLDESLVVPALLSLT